MTTTASVELPVSPVHKRWSEWVRLFGSRRQAKRTHTADSDETWDQLDAAIQTFKHLMMCADSEALKNEGIISPRTVDEAVAGFKEFCLLLNNLIGDAANEHVSVKSDFGARARCEMLPYLLLTETAERFYSKPRGYPGDFLTIELIYQNKPKGVGRIGALIDKCFLDYSACKSVRNRRALLVEEIFRSIHQNGEHPLAVTSLACGPAAEVFDVFRELNDLRELKATCLDIDRQALAFVADKRDNLRLKDRIELVNANLVRVALGRQMLDLKKQDLIYSVGLTDYFSDKLVVKLINWIHDRLRPGGRVILGNFHPRNSAKAILDYVVDWKLIHRNEDQMNSLFVQSAFRKPATAIRFEAEETNMFAECVR